MIYTLTLNPALDYVIRSCCFAEGRLNRAEASEIQFGGKGINVSSVLHNLGVESVAMGFVAGFTGDALEQALHDTGIRTDFVHLTSGMTRINVKLRSSCETEINAPGPDIPEHAVSQLFQKLNQLQTGDILVLAGSAPPSLPEDIYAQILSTVKDRDILAVVDTGGSTLRTLLPYRPFLIKPNLSELQELVGQSVTRIQDIIACAQSLQRSGARNILVSMAEKGSLLLDETGGVQHLIAAKGSVRNSVGAGDSMVAGFLAGWLETGNYAAAHRFGSAAGSASAFSDGLATREQILAIYSQEDDRT